MDKELVDNLRNTLVKAIENDIKLEDSDSLWIVYMKHNYTTSSGDKSLPYKIVFIETTYDKAIDSLITYILGEDVVYQKSEKEFKGARINILHKGNYRVDIQGWRMVLDCYGDRYYIERYKAGTDFSSIMKDDKVVL